MPYAVTSLLPLCFFPMAGIIPSDDVGLNYFKVSNRYFRSYVIYLTVHTELFLGYNNVICRKYDISSCHGTC